MHMQCNTYANSVEIARAKMMSLLRHTFIRAYARLVIVMQHGLIRRQFKYNVFVQFLI